ncbi:hypothetical protein TrST_g13136 [Triparma strigata]|uniref:NAD(P)-binding domain-containing protein n=1 Tax=Triparma strigata TaxID=1606541 RepID=A0A9W7F2S4_9STRA|nr:hypothetical protein TrST_g13136 [Triparma strigata]
MTRSPPASTRLLTLSLISLLIVLILLSHSVHSFHITPKLNISPKRARVSLESSKEPDDPSSLLAEAQRLRDAAAQLKSTLPDRPPPDYPPPPPPSIQVYGSNGLLGSALTRHLLRTTKSPVTALVHDYSRTSKLSLTVGAEDGKGEIQAAWKSLDQSMSFDPSVQSSYGLDRLTVLETEILDPQQLPPPTSLIYFCATDFSGSTPRSLSKLSVGLLFRSISRPLKGRCEIEGLKNIIDKCPKDNTVTIIVPTPKQGVFMDFMTPFGDFYGIKKLQREVLKSVRSDIKTVVVELPRVDVLRETSSGKGAEWISVDDAVRVIAEAVEDQVVTLPL